MPFQVSTLAIDCVTTSGTAGTGSAGATWLAAVATAAAAVAMAGLDTGSALAVTV